MDCPFCKERVEVDSIFCDQCGKELLFCSKCGEPGRGKRCTRDGASMITRKQQDDVPLDSETPTQIIVEEPISKAPLVAGASKTLRKETSGTAKTVRQLPSTASRTERDPATVMKLLLVNDNVNLRLEISSGDILGRTEGRFSNILKSFPKISGRHARFDYDKSEQCWFVTDLGSTNGTKMKVPGHEMVSVEQNQKNKLIHDSFLYISNIEMRISIK